LKEHARCNSEKKTRDFFVFYISLSTITLLHALNVRTFKCNRKVKVIWYAKRNCPKTQREIIKNTKSL